MMMGKKLGLYAVTAAVSLAAAGCSGGGDATTSGGAEESSAEVAAANDFDACSVLSAAEVEAITTDKVVNVRKGDQGTCYYESNPDEDLTLSIKKSGGAKAMEVIRRTAKVLSGMGGVVADKSGAGKDAAELLKEDESAVPKLGDEAAWGMNSTLSVRKGDMFVEVTPPLMHDPATHSGYPLVKTEEKRRIAIDIATKVLAKL
jgi:hypothetical protein